jgi:hypothetical protein
MSSRRPQKSVHEEYANKLRAEINDLKAASAPAPTATDSPAMVYESSSSASLVFEDLSQTEQACASLGAAPDGFRPLQWLNNGHYQQLRENNQMDDTLVRRLEAYRAVASR